MKHIDIIYEDKYILAVHKRAGIATQTRRLGEKDIFSELKKYLNGGYVGIINRLDQPVEGIVITAKDSKTAALLERQIQERRTNKYYRTIVYVSESQKENIKAKVGVICRLEDYIKSNPKENYSEISSKTEDGSKLAKLDYLVKKIDANKAELEIHLLTGRHHQIRLQLSNAGLPILGDLKYGSKECIEFSKINNINNVSLCAYKYEFIHPVTKEILTLEI